MIKDSELILNSDNSVYHLNAKPGDVAPVIVTVGDPERIQMFEKHFDRITHRIQKREFYIVSGYIGHSFISLISTGIGTDNIDIVINEIDALFNIDLETRQIKQEITPLKFIRVGTSGAIRPEIPIDSTIVSRYAIGMDSLLHYYKDQSIRETILEQKLEQNLSGHQVYAVASSQVLADKFSQLGPQGITVTAPGFYAPQGRQLRLDYTMRVSDRFKEIEYEGLRCTNLEMETSGIYGLTRLLGHEAISLNAILANRVNGEFSSDPNNTIQTLIDNCIEIVRNF